jgi:beta-ureidopropionase
VQPTPINDESVPVAEIQEAMFQKHLPFIEEAAKKGVQILCLQEIFNGPYFCPSQDKRWYAAAEPVPGPTTERIAAYAKKYNMVIVVPSTSEEMRGVFYNTAAVIDADGTYLGQVPQAAHPPGGGFWEKFFFTPGNGGYPVFKTKYATIGVYICYDRHFPEGARCLGLNGAEIVFNPSATVKGLSQYLWKLEQPAHAVANGYYVGAINRVGTEAPWNIGKFYGTSYFVNPRGQILAEACGGQRRARRRRPRPLDDRRGPPDLAVLPRSPPRRLRRDRQEVGGFSPGPCRTAPPSIRALILGGRDGAGHSLHGRRHRRADEGGGRTSRAFGERLAGAARS